VAQVAGYCGIQVHLAPIGCPHRRR
jgi:hypothetical protein